MDKVRVYLTQRNNGSLGKITNVYYKQDWEGIPVAQILTWTGSPIVTDLENKILPLFFLDSPFSQLLMSESPYKYYSFYEREGKISSLLSYAVNTALKENEIEPEFRKPITSGRFIYAADIVEEEKLKVGFHYPGTRPFGMKLDPLLVTASYELLLDRFEVWEEGLKEQVRTYQRGKLDLQHQLETLNKTLQSLCAAKISPSIKPSLQNESSFQLELF